MAYRFARPCWQWFWERCEMAEREPREEMKVTGIRNGTVIDHIISDYRVTEKSMVQLPETIERIVKCYNPRCVTNQQPMETCFEVIDESPPALRCRYCERVMKGRDILLK